jgi:hypothetical protein
VPTIDEMPADVWVTHSPEGPVAAMAGAVDAAMTRATVHAPTAVASARARGRALFMMPPGRIELSEPKSATAESVPPERGGLCDTPRDIRDAEQNTGCLAPRLQGDEARSSAPICCPSDGIGAVQRR